LDDDNCADDPCFTDYLDKLHASVDTTEDGEHWDDLLDYLSDSDDSLVSSKPLKG
jgi:hypothetical protein